jgi:deoxyguanosine kinase
MVIALEGLPGAGKTTTSARLGELLGAEVVQETTGQHPFLAQVYDDLARDDLTVELAFLLVHANPYRRIDRAVETVCDFSPVKDMLFAEDMLRNRELEFFGHAFETLYAGHALPDVAVYLRLTPAVCLERIERRMRADSARRFEAGLTAERLERMLKRYEQSLQRLAKHCIAYDVDPAADEHDVAHSLAELLAPFRG